MTTEFEIIKSVIENPPHANNDEALVLTNLAYYYPRIPLYNEYFLYYFFILKKLYESVFLLVLEMWVWNCLNR